MRRTLMMAAVGAASVALLAGCQRRNQEQEGVGGAGRESEEMRQEAQEAGEEAKEAGQEAQQKGEQASQQGQQQAQQQAQQKSTSGPLTNVERDELTVRTPEGQELKFQINEQTQI